MNTTSRLGSFLRCANCGELPEYGWHHDMPYAKCRCERFSAPRLRDVVKKWNKKQRGAKRRNMRILRQEKRIAELEAKNASLREWQRESIEEAERITPECLQIAELEREGAVLKERLECPLPIWNGNFAFIGTRNIGDISKRGSYWRASFLGRWLSSCLSEADAKAAVESAWPEFWNKIHGQEAKESTDEKA